MNEEAQKQIEGVIVEQMKAVPEIINAVVSEKIAEFKTTNAAEMEEVKNELKKFTLDQKKANPVVKEAFVKTAMVAITKAVVQGNVSTEKAFYDVANATLKTMTEGTSGDGQELVFDQFEADVLRKIYTYSVPAMVKTTTLAKGEKVTIPKKTGNCTTAYTGEGVAATDTNFDTGSVVYDIYKTTTFTSLTEELLDDTMTIPDLYDLIVDDIAESQTAFLEGEIIAGSGSSAIQGILLASGLVSQSLAATKKVADITDDNIADMVGALDQAFDRGNVQFLMSKFVLTALQKLKTADGYPLYPELRGINPTLWGYPVKITRSTAVVQATATNVATKPAIIFGNFDKYRVVRRKGISLERGQNADDFQKGLTSIRSVARFGGKAEFGEAFVVLKNGAAS